MATRKRDLSPDPEGRYRPYVGWKQGEDGVRRQHRFNLGTDRKEAERRLAKIRELYEESLRVYDNGRLDVWSPLALSYAEQIARGKKRIDFPPLSPDAGYTDTVAEYVQMLNFSRRCFPSLDLVPADPDLYAESARINDQIVARRLGEVEREMKELDVLPTKHGLPRELIPGTLHEALADYVALIPSQNAHPDTGDLKAYGNRRLERVGRFRKAHEDIPLYALNYDVGLAMITHWRNRPEGMRGATSRDNARHHIGELLRFFRWLDTTEKYQWRMPRGLEHADRKIAKMDSERKISAVTKPVYSVDELAILNRHATPLERLVLYVGLNCAMGAAEMGRLEAGDILLDRRHEYAGSLHFESSDDDSFIRFLRPKTDVFGEWLLWPETAAMLRWGLGRARRIGSKLLLVSEKGQPWYNVAATNAQYKFANTWTRLLKRVRKSPSHSNFRNLPFGTLRDTLPDVLRHVENDDLASLSLAHGSPFRGDSLLECYGNKPFGRLHKALRRLHDHFAPVFAAAPENPFEEGKTYLSIEVKQQIRAMLDEGGVPAEIARACGVSPMTVHREAARLHRGRKDATSG